jgi:cell division protein FtsB
MSAVCVIILETEIDMNPLFVARMLVVFFLCVVLNGIIRGTHSVSGFFDLKKSHDLIEQTVEALKSENEGLETEISRILNSKDYANKVLRDKYHIIDKDEELIFFDD